jgi:hypothetical protein
MQINLGGAVAGAATAISVLDEYFQELHRIERIPPSIPLAQGVVELTLLLDAPRFEMVKPANADPYTRLLLTGSVERRFGGAPPEVFPLDVKVLMKIVDLPEATVGLQFDGLDETPSSPLTENDVRNLFLGPALFPLLDGIRIPSGKRIIEGLQGLEELDPQFDIPDVEGWAFEVTLMPAGSDTVDSFMASIGFLTARPVLRESFVPEGQEFAIAFSDRFLDLILEAGAKAQEGKVIEEAKILAPLEIYMNPDSIQVNGRARREMWSIFPDVTVSFVGPMHPFLVRGTTIMGFDMDDIDVDVGDFEGGLLLSGEVVHGGLCRRRARHWMGHRHRCRDPDLDDPGAGGLEHRRGDRERPEPRSRGPGERARSRPRGAVHKPRRRDRHRSGTCRLDA